MNAPPNGTIAVKRRAGRSLLLAAVVGTLIPVAQAQNFQELALDNGVIRVGVNVSSYGGAITYLSASGSGYNLVNNHDRGRQIQQSYYAGQLLDRRSEGQHPNYTPWQWNPIQVGDVYMNPASVPAYYNSGSEIYTYTQPRLWDMNNEGAACAFETWIRLEGNKVVVRNKLTKWRPENDRWGADRAQHQELPAVYTIADLMHLHSYEGDTPFMDGPLRKLVDNGRQVPSTNASGPPWFYWGTPSTTEKWAAFVNHNNWGVGVCYPDTELFIGGFTGTAGGTTLSNSTGYVSPLRTMTLKRNEVFEYTYYLVVGDLTTIREQAIDLQGYRIWSRGAGSDSLGTDGNWRLGNAPQSGDTMVFNTGGTTATNLTYSGTFGGAAGVGLSVGPGRTQPLNFTPASGAVFRLRPGTNTIASGAAAVTFAAGGSGATVELGPGESTQTFFLNNNSAQPLTFAPGTVVRRAEGLTNATLEFRGTGAAHVLGVIESLGTGIIRVRDGLLRLGGTNQHTGNLDAESGILEFTSAEALGATGGRLKIGQSALTGTVRYSGESEARIGRSVLIGNGNTDGSTGGSIIEAEGTGPMIFTNANFNGSVAQTAAVVRTLTLQGSSTADNEVRGVIRDNPTSAGRLVRLVKDQPGLWILSGANTYTGGTVIQGGTLRLDGAGRLGGGAVTIGGGARLALATTGTNIMAGDISGDGQLLVTGGDTRLTGQLTVTGGVTIDGGTLRVGNNGATGSYNGNVVVNGGALAFDRSDIHNHGGVISGAGGVTKLGTGTLILTGGNDFTGTLGVQAGELDLNSTAAGGAAGATTNVTVGPGAILLVSRSNQINDAARVSLDGGSIRRGAGVSEIFGDLHVTAASSLDFGMGAAGTFEFRKYTNAANSPVTVHNFGAGNQLRFLADSFGTDDLGDFNFGSSFYTTASEDGYFTITSIAAKVWTGGAPTSTNFSSGNNWQDGVAPSGTSNAYHFVFDADHLRDPFRTTAYWNNGTFGVLSLTLKGNETYPGFSVLAQSGGNSTLKGDVTVVSGAHSLTFSNTLATDTTWTVAEGASVSRSLGSFRMAGHRITKTGGGMLRIFGANSVLDGTFEVQQGVLRFAPTNSTLTLGAATLALNGGTFEFFNNTARTNNTNATTTVLGDSTVRLVRTNAGAGLTQQMGALHLGSGRLAVTADDSVTSGTAEWTFGATTLSNNASVEVVNNEAGATTRLTLGAVGETGGSHGLTKTGDGELVFAGANTYRGPTIVAAGSLIVAGDQSAATGEVVVASGAILGGSGTLGGPLTLQTGARWRLDPASTLTVRGAVSGGFTLADVVGLDAGVAEGSYTLMAGAVTAASFSPLGAGAAQDVGGGKSAWFEADQSGLRLVVAAAVPGFADWAQRYGLSGDNAMPQAAPAGDGIANLFKYAFNLDPGRHEGSGQYPGGYRGLPYLEPDAGGAYLQMIYYRDRDKSGIRIRPMWSSSLRGSSGWSEVPDREITGTSGRIEQWRARIPMDGGQGFLRIEVESE